MRAIEANPSQMVELVMDELCPDCPLRTEFDGGKVFVSIDTRGAPTSAAAFNISDSDKPVWYAANGTVRRENLIDAFNDCERAVKNGSINALAISCGALIKLQGREEN
jgi:hypothetical protein